MNSVAASGHGVVVGIGARPDPDAALIVRAVRKEVGGRAIHCLATVDRRANEAGVIAAAAELGVPVVGFAAEELAEVDVPHPASRTATALGTPSVAEAAALLACRQWCGSGRLIVPKTAVAGLTIAVAEPE